MLDGFLDETQQWLREYYQRSLAETHRGCRKHRNPRPLRRRRAWRRDAEKRVRLTKDNLVRLAYLRRLGKIRIPWAGQPGAKSVPRPVQARAQRPGAANSAGAETLRTGAIVLTTR